MMKWVARLWRQKSSSAFTLLLFLIPLTDTFGIPNKNGPCGGYPSQTLRLQDRAAILCILHAPERSRLPVRVSPQCLTKKGSPACGALALIEPNPKQRAAILKSFENPDNESIDRSGGKNPAALFCTYIQGKPLIAESRDGSQDTVCQATDGTLILAWDLYEAFQR